MKSSPPVILVTGASSGIGAATAKLFAHEGYRVILAARRKEKLEVLVNEIEIAGGQALAVPTDIAQLDQIENLVAQSLTYFGQVDVLLNNAGVGQLDWLDALDPQRDIALQIQVNLAGVLQMTRSLLPHMIERRRGHIINMASIAALVGTPTYSVYAATKFGLRGFTEALRREVGIHNIHVSGVYPGGVSTEFGQKAGIQRKTGLSTPKFLKLTPEDVAQTVLQVAKRPRRLLIIPRVMALAFWINTLLPGVVDRLIEQRFTKRER